MTVPSSCPAAGRAGPRAGPVLGAQPGPRGGALPPPASNLPADLERNLLFLFPKAEMCMKITARYPLNPLSAPAAGVQATPGARCEGPRAAVPLSVAVLEPLSG